MIIAEFLNKLFFSLNSKAENLTKILISKLN